MDFRAYKLHHLVSFPIHLMLYERAFIKIKLNFNVINSIETINNSYTFFVIADGRALSQKFYLRQKYEENILESNI